MDKNTFRHIAKLAKLRFTGDEAKGISEEIEMILTRFDNISSDIRKIETEKGLQKSCELGNFNKSDLREDMTIDFENREGLCPDKKRMEDNYIAIPKILD